VNNYYRSPNYFFSRCICTFSLRSVDLLSCEIDFGERFVFRPLFVVIFGSDWHKKILAIGTFYFKNFCRKQFGNDLLPWHNNVAITTTIYHPPSTTHHHNHHSHQRHRRSSSNIRQLQLQIRIRIQIQIQMQLGLAARISHRRSFTCLLAG